MEVDPDEGLKPGACLLVNPSALTDPEYVAVSRDEGMEELTAKMYVFWTGFALSLIVFSKKNPTGRNLSLRVHIVFFEMLKLSRK